MDRYQSASQSALWLTNMEKNFTADNADTRGCAIHPRSYLSARICVIRG